MSDTAIRHDQELLALAGIPVTIDGQDGPQTRFARAAYAAVSPVPLAELFQRLHARATMILRVTKPVRLSRAALDLARGYLDVGAREVGRQNGGPWVRLFLSGSEGDGAAWCAGFAACTVLTEAAAAVGTPEAQAVAQRYHSPWCPTLLARARADGRLVTDLAAARPGMLVLYLRDRDGDGQQDDAAHVGIVEHVDAAAGMVLAIEGNSGDGSDPGGRERVARHIRTTARDRMVFVDVDR